MHYNYHCIIAMIVLGIFGFYNDNIIEYYSFFNFDSVSLSSRI